MLPTNPKLHDAYRERLRKARAKQDAPTPKGTKFTEDHCAAISAATKKSLKHNSKNQKGEKNPNFKGGFHDKHGYKILTVDGKQIPEHRLVMEGIIGRKLTALETVHHKNGIRDDNSPSNLELWASRNPRGQRVQDMTNWAIEYLESHGYFVSPSKLGFVEGLLFGVELVHH